MPQLSPALGILFFTSISLSILVLMMNLNLIKKEVKIF